MSKTLAEISSSHPGLTPQEYQLLFNNQSVFDNHVTHAMSPSEYSKWLIDAAKVLVDAKQRATLSSDEAERLMLEEMQEQFQREGCEVDVGSTSSSPNVPEVSYMDFLLKTHRATLEGVVLEFSWVLDINPEHAMSDEALSKWRCEKAAEEYVTTHGLEKEALMFMQSKQQSPAPLVYHNSTPLMDLASSAQTADCSKAERIFINEFQSTLQRIATQEVDATSGLSTLYDNYEEDDVCIYYQLQGVDSILMIAEKLGVPKIASKIWNKEYTTLAELQKTLIMYEQNPSLLDSPVIRPASIDSSVANSQSDIPLVISLQKNQSQTVISSSPHSASIDPTSHDTEIAAAMALSDACGDRVVAQRLDFELNDVKKGKYGDDKEFEMEFRLVDSFQKELIKAFDNGITTSNKNGEPVFIELGHILHKLRRQLKHDNFSRGKAFFNNLTKLENTKLIKAATLFKTTSFFSLDNLLEVLGWNQLFKQIKTATKDDNGESESTAETPSNQAIAPATLKSILKSPVAARSSGVDLDDCKEDLIVSTSTAITHKNVRFHDDVPTFDTEGNGHDALALASNNLKFLASDKPRNKDEIDPQNTACASSHYEEEDELAMAIAMSLEPQKLDVVALALTHESSLDDMLN